MKIQEILSSFGIEQMNNGASTGSSWIKTQGEIIDVYSPVDGALMASVKSAEVVEFVNFYIENAGELSKDVGYIPLPAENYIEQKNKFQTFVKSNN